MNFQALNYQPKKANSSYKGYFSQKSELLTWASSILDLEITCFEQTSTGAIFCQILDACHPGSVRMNKVNWEANCETQYIANFKIFQQGLDKNNINKSIDINRLANGKINDLNELLQWLYGYYYNYKDNYIGIYNAKRARGGKNLIFSKKNYKKKFIKNNFRDNYSQVSNSSIKSDSISQSDNYSCKYNNFNSKRNNNFNKPKQNNTNNNYSFNNRNYSNNRQFEKLKRNKSKGEIKNSKYHEFKNKLLNNNNCSQNKIHNNNFSSNQCQLNNNIMTNKITNTLSKSYNFSNQNNNNYHNNINESKYKNYYTKNKYSNKIIENSIPSNRIPNNYDDYVSTPSEQINLDLDNYNNNLKYNDDDEYFENENELDLTDFYGLNEMETKNLFEEEKNDGDKVINLKKIIRKLRISKISKEKELNDIKNAIISINKLKNFYLNKLKDIEYLYFNPIIKNSNDNKNTILRQILCSEKDSTIYIDENNYAFLPNKNTIRIENKVNKYHKYKSQPQSSKKINKKYDEMKYTIDNNKNKIFMDDGYSMKFNSSSKKEYNHNYINDNYNFSQENNEKFNFEKEIIIQNNRNKNINENSISSDKFSSNNTTNINYNIETQIDSQFYNNSEYNFDEKISKKNHKIIPVKLTNNKNKIFYYNNQFINSNKSQNLNTNHNNINQILSNTNNFNPNLNNINPNLNNIGQSFNNIRSNSNNINNNDSNMNNKNNCINNNLNCPDNVQKENIQLNYQKNLYNNIIENGNFEGKKDSENYNGEESNYNEERSKYDNKCKLEVNSNIQNNYKYKSKTESKYSNSDIASKILNDSLHIPGV